MVTQPDPFIPVVPYEKLHPTFKVLMEHASYAPARGLIRELFTSFTDPDGNFVEQFQTTGFDARIWELYLNTYLVDAGFQVNRCYASPDFIVTHNGDTICIEAVTANPTTINSEANTDAINEERSADIVRYRQQHLNPIKLGSALFSKLQKKYWELEHVQGKPLIFAIEDFHETDSLTYSDVALTGYLYGIDTEWSLDSEGNLDIKLIPVSFHKHANKVIPSGFFSQPGAEYVSAVLFSNSGTLYKFQRMGHLGKHRSEKIQMIRIGTCYNHSPDIVPPRRFIYEVGDPDFPESWGQGLTLCHNPNALHPVPPDSFPDVTEITLVKGMLEAKHPPFHPFGSQTLVFYFESP